jgi:hypothetical protein
VLSVETRTRHLALGPVDPGLQALLVYALLFVGLALAFVLASGSFGVSRWISRRWYRLRLQRLARRSRLYLHSGALRVTGWLEGHYVVAWRDLYSAHVAVRIWPGLDLGLRRLPRDHRSAADYLRMVVQYSREHLRSRLMVDGDISNAVRQAPFDIEIFDDWILVSEGLTHGFRKLPKMLRFALEVAESIATRRKRLPPPPVQSELTHAVSQLGTKHLLAPLGSPLGYEGSAFGGNVAVFVQHDGSRRESACVVARFREPLDIGFCAEPGRPAALAWGQAKYTVGEREFDERFTVSAAEPEFVERALSPSARTRLCEMADIGRKVRVDDYGVSIECDTALAPELEQICSEAAAVAGLVDFVHPKKLGNPYR